MFEQLEQLQNFLVPLSLKFSSVQKEESRRMMKTLLYKQSASQRFKLKIFLLLIDIIAIGRFLKTFKNLSINQKEFVCRWLFDSPISLLRKGFWGVNTLCKLGVYGQSSVYHQIHYELRPKTK